MTGLDSSSDLHSFQSRRAAWLVEREPELPGDADACESRRAVLRQQFMKSLGLDPMPPRGDLGARELGTFSGPGYTATKLAYQLLPDCWGSAHYYRPAGEAAETRLPAVLYACGHSNPGVVHFQEHAIGWARRGYACLIFDTIQQHDNPGDHHGLNHGETPEWIGLGYSAAGGEVFNGLRALDLLREQPGVDPVRVGVTGISGGGSQSFFLAIADPRLAAVATVAGVSDAAYAIHEWFDRNDSHHVDGARPVLSVAPHHRVSYSPGSEGDSLRKRRRRSCTVVARQVIQFSHPWRPL